MSVLKYNLLGITYVTTALFLLVLGTILLFGSLWGIFENINLHNFIPHPATRCILGTFTGLILLYGGGIVFGELDKLSLKYKRNEK